MRDALREACEVLGIESAGLTASQMAECCISELYDADAISVTVCRRKERCCQPETPVCDLTVWCDFIGARHASITP